MQVYLLCALCAGNANAYGEGVNLFSKTGLVIRKVNQICSLGR